MKAACGPSMCFFAGRVRFYALTLRAIQIVTDNRKRVFYVSSVFGSYRCKETGLFKAISILQLLLLWAESYAAYLRTSNQDSRHASLVNTWKGACESKKDWTWHWNIIRAEKVSADLIEG
jgi:hypothetical protein